ncbi:sulfotransferase family 2 domain-containing protein [Methyloligella sp. 2.7D]|uniref:sulfotransferase family 2 domain-containing protein n=1 Tax=unclassified Methyloligella TaxID=2625955 RepID=UPI00157BF2E0|nr:sulfotransferase family 2 domain-containing protein [Methyloligella sp. GL2]QKP78027.1 sulfotransferase family 2 domain-containing protein [Methyloligella sp. GL2]
MIISHEHKFIFIKTKKTAGTAIEAALSELCGPDDVITPYREQSEAQRKGRKPQNYRVEHPEKPQRPLLRRLLRRPERYYHQSVGYYEHMPAWRVRTYIGEAIWNSYFKFAFERNPFDRQVSWYFYKTKSMRKRPSFERFMAKRARAFVNNHDLYLIDGKPALDFVGRYESLEEDLNRALTLAGVAQTLSIPKVNVGPGKESRESYRSYFTPELRTLVAEWYRPEIEMFDYRF